MIACIPFGLFKVIPREGGHDELFNFITFNYAYIPRIYVICLIFKLARIRKAWSVLRKVAKKLGAGIDKTNLTVTLWSLLLILHLIACFWGAAASFNLSSNLNWMFVANIEDQSIFSKYLTSLYWASTTIITVGYGDILPRNVYELTLTCFILLIGVVLFSYSLSTLANQFASLN